MLRAQQNTKPRRHDYIPFMAFLCFGLVAMSRPLQVRGCPWTTKVSAILVPREPTHALGDQRRDLRQHPTGIHRGMGDAIKPGPTRLALHAPSGMYSRQHVREQEILHVQLVPRPRPQSHNDVQSRPDYQRDRAPLSEPSASITATDIRHRRRLSLKDPRV